MKFEMFDSSGRFVTTGIGAPGDATFVVMSADASLTQERILTGSSSLLVTDGGANNPVTLSVIDNTSIQKVEIVKNSGAVVGTRKQLNFIEGVGITLTVADDGGNDQVDITIDAATAVGYTTIEEEGVAIVQRSTINFVGAGITASDVGAKSQVTLDADLNTIAGLAVARGAIMVGNAVPAWSILTLGGFAGQILMSDGTDLAYSTTTYPNTTTINRILFSSAANTIGEIPAANYAIVNSSAVGVPSMTATPVISTSLEIGVAGVATGVLKLSGTTSGTVSVTTAAAAGTWTLTLPITDGTANQFLQTDGGGITTWATPLGYTLMANFAIFNPVSSQTRHWGGFYTLGPNSMGGSRRIYVGQAGTITDVSGFFSTGALGGAETITMFIRLNNTTNTNFTTTATMSAGITTFTGNPNVAVVAGDYVEIGMTHPAWATPPTTVLGHATITVT